MDLESRIVALEGSLARQRKISTVLLCLLFAGLVMGATHCERRDEDRN